MSKEEKNQKLQEVLADKAFAEKLLGLETAEEVQAALSDKGVEFSTQEINDIRQGVIKQLEGGEELAPEQLKNVAGGIVITTAVGIVSGIVSIASAGAAKTHDWTRGRW